MADSKLAHSDPMQNPSPTPKRPKSQDAPRSRSERKAVSGSSKAPPEGQPRKLEFGADEEGGNRYSPRNIDPETPFPPKQVAQLVATYEGKQIEGEATKRLHEEAAADGFAALEKADAEGYAAALAKIGNPEPIQITKTNPFATASGAQQQIAPTAADELATPIPSAEQIPVPTPAKRKKSTGGDDKDNDDEMDEDGGDPNTLAQEVQLRKIHQTLRRFADRMAHSEETIEGQGRMVDQLAARHRQEEQERISRTYEILGIPEKANAT